MYLYCLRAIVKAYAAYYKYLVPFMWILCTLQILQHFLVTSANISHETVCQFNFPYIFSDMEETMNGIRMRALQSNPEAQLDCFGLSEFSIY